MTVRHQRPDPTFGNPQRRFSLPALTFAWRQSCPIDSISGRIGPENHGVVGYIIYLSSVCFLSSLLSMTFILLSSQWWWEITNIFPNSLPWTEVTVGFIFGGVWGLFDSWAHDWANAFIVKGRLLWEIENVELVACARSCVRHSKVEPLATTSIFTANYNIIRQSTK